MLGKNKGSSITREEVLSSIPVRNKLMGYDKNEKGEAVITLQRRFNRGLKLLSKIIYLSDRKVITLDKLGTEVLELCDGTTTFRDLVGIFSSKYKLNRKEAEASMTAYMKSLTQRGIIALAIKGGSGNG